MIRKRQVRHVRQYLSSTKLKQRRRKRKVWRIVLLSISALILLGLFLYINTLQIFQVKEIEVRGNTLVATDMVTMEINTMIHSRSVMLGLIPSTNLFFISNHDIEEGLKQKFLRIGRVKVDTSLGGKMSVLVEEKEVVAVWCNDNSQNVCYDLDKEGYMFEHDNIKVSFPYIYQGIFTGQATSSIIGKQFMAGEYMQKSKQFIDFLIAQGLAPVRVVCDQGLTCMAYINPQKNTRIVYDVHTDLILVQDRLKVALESDMLKNKDFTYIDTRFGNKLFYKQGGTQEDDETASSSQRQTNSSTTSASSESKKSLR